MGSEMCIRDRLMMIQLRQRSEVSDKLSRQLFQTAPCCCTSNRLVVNDWGKGRTTGQVCYREVTVRELPFELSKHILVRKIVLCEWDREEYGGRCVLLAISAPAHRQHDSVTGVDMELRRATQ